MHVSAIIAAGGRGLRLGASRPKQLLPVAFVNLLAIALINQGGALLDQLKRLI